MTTIKTIDGSKTTDGQPLIVSITTDGYICIDGVKTADRPIVRKGIYGHVSAPLDGMPATIAGWVWANNKRLPKGSKIGFTAAELAAAYAAAKEALDALEALSNANLAARKARAAKERAFDNLYNEGGEGYNPHRASDDLSGTAFDRRERHYPKGA